MTGHAPHAVTRWFRIALPLALSVAAFEAVAEETSVPEQPNADVIGRIIPLGAPYASFPVSAPPSLNAFPPEILQRMREALILRAENPQSGGTKTRKND